jgi:hypothetical protein
LCTGASLYRDESARNWEQGRGAFAKQLVECSRRSVDLSIDGG